MKLVDVAIFTFPNDAAVLESILLREKIEYFLNNPDAAIIVPGSGATISVNEDDLPKTIALIKEAGFEKNLVSYE
jgi:GMP synthase-like glutamine amidotransferase